MTARVVCISNVLGGGGEEIGRLVAEGLGFSYVNDEIIAWAAAKGGVSPAEVANAEERQSALGRILAEIGRSAIPETLALSGFARMDEDMHETSDDLTGLIQSVVTETAARGDVVIGAHGASFALAREPGVLRVHFVASPDTRVARVSESSHLDAKDAEKAIKDSDRARAGYLNRFFGIKAEQPTHYDLVVNTDALSPAQAAAVVVGAAS
jgi:cytidylate kinase